MTSMTDALGNTERYETNLNKQVVKKIQKDGTIYKYNYDRVKRLTSTIDPMNYRINMEYSLGDDVLKTTDTLGRQVNYEYDILHNLTKKTDANGKYNLYTYDYRNNVVRHIDRRETIENFTYDLTDNLIEHKDKNENITRYTYDRVGNIKEVRQPNGALTKYEYDRNYNRIKVTNPRGKITNYTYDRDNRLVSETDPNGNTKRYNYNNNNNLKEYTTALGNTQKYEYDTDNNLIKEIDPRNKIKQYTYDKNNRLTKTTSELNNSANFTYDVVDNVIGIKDPKGTNTVFDYNDIGKVVQERSVDNTIRTYNYDRAGRLISKINKDRTKIAYDYDENDNIIKKYYLDLHNRETDNSIVYSYNGENMRLGMNDKNGLSKTLYDNNGNLVESTSNQNRDKVQYEYDENNRLIKMKYPNDIIVTYTYDDNGNIKKVTDKDGLKTYYTYDDNDNEVIRTTGLVETERRYDADNRLIRIRNQHKMSSELIDEYSYRYDSNNNIIEEIKREPYRKKINLLDMEEVEENDRTIRVTKQTFTYDDENKLTDARVERLGMKALTEPSVTTYHYEYDQNGNRTLVDIKDDNLTMESTVYEYDRLNRMIRSREVTAKGLYIYEYKYDDNGNLIQEDRHRAYETQPVLYQNIRRYEYTKDNKLEAVYSGNILLVAYTYDGDGTITSSLDRDLDFNQNLNINDRSYLNRLTNNQRQLINKVNPNDSFLYELTEYVMDRNQEYSQVLMERDGTGQLSSVYTYGNQRINYENYNNLTGIYTYDGRGSVSAVIGGYGDFRASYWYDGLGNVKSQIHGYGVFGNGKKYFGYNAEQYNPVTGNQNLRARQVNIRRQRFLTEDTYLGNKTDILSLNRYIYGNGNPLKYKDPSGHMVDILLEQYGPALIDYADDLWNIVASGFVATGTWIATREISKKIKDIDFKTLIEPRPRVQTFVPRANDSEIRRQVDATAANIYILDISFSKSESNVKKAISQAESLSQTNTCGGVGYNNNEEDDDDNDLEKYGPNKDYKSNETKIDSGKSRPPKTSEPNSIYEQLNDDGTVKSRAFYNDNGNEFARQDFDHSHYSKELNEDLLNGHEHTKFYNGNGQVNGKKLAPLPNGYDNLPSIISGGDK